MAVTSAGTVILNATHLGDGASLADIIKIATASGRPIYIGVEIETSRELLRWIDDAAAEIVCAIGGPIVSRAAAYDRAEALTRRGPSTDRPSDRARRRSRGR
jgi:hypothetical protein